MGQCVEVFEGEAVSRVGQNVRAWKLAAVVRVLQQNGSFQRF